MAYRQNFICNGNYLVLLCIFRFLFYTEVSRALWFLTDVLDVMLILLGIGLTASSLICLLLGKARFANSVTAVFLAGIIYLGWFSDTGSHLGICFRLWRHEDTYQKFVSKVLAGDRAK